MSRSSITTAVLSVPLVLLVIILADAATLHNTYILGLSCVLSLLHISMVSIYAIKAALQSIRHHRLLQAQGGGSGDGNSTLSSSSSSSLALQVISFTQQRQGGGGGAGATNHKPPVAPVLSIREQLRELSTISEASRESSSFFTTTYTGDHGAGYHPNQIHALRHQDSNNSSHPFSVDSNNNNSLPSYYPFNRTDSNNRRSSHPELEMLPTVTEEAAPLPTTTTTTTTTTIPAIVSPSPTSQPPVTMQQRGKEEEEEEGAANRFPPPSVGSGSSGSGDPTIAGRGVGGGGMMMAGAVAVISAMAMLALRVSFTAMGAAATMLVYTLMPEDSPWVGIIRQLFMEATITILAIGNFFCLRVMSLEVRKVMFRFASSTPTTRIQPSHT